MYVSSLEKEKSMNIEDYREYCLSVKEVIECMPFGEHTLVFKVMDKMFTFASLRPKDGRFWADILSFQCTTCHETQGSYC